jgi:hypothetical protein
MSLRWGWVQFCGNYKREKEKVSLPSKFLKNITGIKEFCLYKSEITTVKPDTRIDPYKIQVENLISSG